MAGIEKYDASSGIAAFDYPASHPMMALWLEPQQGLLPRLQQALATRGVHPSRTLVLLPYAQLRPLAAHCWMQWAGDGLAPRFETTMNWCSSRSGFVPGATDIHMETGWDLLTAQDLLTQAGLGAQRDMLAGLLVQAAHQLAPLAAAHAPDQRAQWAVQAREAAVLGMAGSALGWETAVARIAVEWAAISAYASDLLFEPAQADDVDCLVLVQGLAPDPLASGLASAWGARLLTLPLQADALREPPAPLRIGLHACQDGEDEAQRCAAQALAHIAAGQCPVALVSSDRLLTRRVRALLAEAGVAMRDENGWKLSTSRAAAALMALLQACAWNASSDEVLACLKLTPAWVPDLDALEAALRRAPVRDWRQVAGSPRVRSVPALVAQVQQVDALRASAKGVHSLAGWLGWLQAALQRCGLWAGLETDAAGGQMLAALRLQAAPVAATQALLSQALWAQRRLDLAEFSAWVNAVLESAHFKPPYPAHEQLAILPMSQMLGRPFAAVLLAGCDEVRLPSAPEPPGHWTRAQRLALGLPSREALQAQLQAAWHSALRTPLCDVFWRESDDTGEALLPSALVQGLALAHPEAQPAPEPRLLRHLPADATPRPLPQGDRLPVTRLTQGAYEDLRQCPYRFFALRQLGLQPADELDEALDKRDFGVWLHAVLEQFHTALAAQDGPKPVQRLAALEQAAQDVTRAMALHAGEFLPFAAAWPAVRDGYLRWLQDHEQNHAAVFQQGESEQRRAVGALELHGRIDRIDRLGDGSAMVLDYKTEDSAKTRSRVKDPLEDTQMAFYAALLGDAPHAATLRGAYVTLSEKKTESFEQGQLLEARDALVHGMQTDLARIAQGNPLPALGQGAACDYCQARGLCRKDFWQ